MKPDAPLPNAYASLEQHIPPELRQGLEILLSRSAAPEVVVGRLAGFCGRHPSEFQQLAYMPFGLQALVAVFSSSGFLSAEILEHPAWLMEILGSGQLHRTLRSEELEAELEEWLGPGGEAPEAVRLAGFRRRQILRILLRDQLGFGALPEVTEELSGLADALLQCAYRRIRASHERRFGVPGTSGGGVCGFSVVALGKLGGWELNYSSDIDLMFLYGEEGRTDGPRAMSNAEFFRRVAAELTALLGTYTAEGLIYRVDLRLRPDGRHGELCLPLAGALRYYESRARDWELQMLIKARVAAGEPEPGRELLERVQPRIYASSLDFSAIERMSATRERINEKLAVRKRQAGIDVKLARGGIRDIEFLVQCLQRLHGGREAWVRNSSTLLALVRLRDKDLLADSEYSRLASAYQFLRHLEHRLQADEDRQTHVLPEKLEELRLVARRMPQPLVGEQATPEGLLAALNAHLEHVAGIYERVVHAQQPLYYAEAAIEEQPAVVEPAEGPGAPVSNLIRFLDQRAPLLGAAIGRARLGRSQGAFEHFLERVMKREDWLDALERDAALCGYVLDIFAHSPYFAEQLMRQPEYLEEIRTMRERGVSSTDYAEVMPLLEDAGEIRRFYLRRMFRLQAESLCLQRPVFDTLESASKLAEAAVAACFRLAVAQSGLAPAPGAGQMMVIALGRLGMQEFDLGSDADLIFVAPDQEAGRLAEWTRVAEKLVAILASYTGDGTMFSVDTRLCPNGRGGALVQTESAYREYFERSAEAWEGVAYMKSRAVAGDVERATAFLAELQRIDWRRYGQSGRSRAEIREMRLRLEREMGEDNPLKTAAGGYYDIDFALMYLRLRGAGLFYKVLNTPARIEVLENMGHLEHNDARFLMDAATFYRAVDHGLRLISGHTEGSLPHSEAQLAMLTKLVGRWVPPHLCDQPLPLELRQIRERTREFFDRLFVAKG